MLRPRRIDSMRSSLGSSEDDEAPLPTEMPDLQRASTLDAVVEAWRKVAERSGNVTPGSRPPALSPGARLRAEGVPCDIFLEVPPRRRAQSCSDSLSTPPRPHLSAHASCSQAAYATCGTLLDPLGSVVSVVKVRAFTIPPAHSACSHRLFTPRCVHRST